MWQLIGEIDGGAGGDQSGNSVSLSSDGMVVAVGAYLHDGNGDNSGHVRVFAFNESVWVQRGQDIEGEAAHDLSGRSVSLSSDGTVVAMGATGNDINGFNSGHARVFVFNESAWVQRGQNIDGEADGDLSGRPISLSSDGKVVAVSARLNDGNGSSSGHVRVFAFNGSVWVPRGQDVDGEADVDESGSSVSLSSDGTVMAVGAPFNDENGENSGHVRVYEFNGTMWVQRGLDIDGEAAGDWSGISVSLSSDGTVMAVGSPYNDGSGGGSGHVRVFEWNGSVWVRRGQDIDGEEDDDLSGWSVSLSSDGTFAAVGALYNDGFGERSGHVRVFEWNGSMWVQRGQDIDGEAVRDSSGWSVSLSSDGTVVAVGAPFNDGNGLDSGHVRIHRLEPA